ncbi:hypothetical protein RM550_31860 [Streptomyces sp. DSM 41527]|uniref:DUF397 domain-containing protein n=1 Tax=Streptomyces mooreae TaxID=3075523 RepID=A0ABU2TH54_9ACTN|nr:hypothetical protein [Streptomyces sp. DSM 41527]MDT0460267.1 hypothetical protein [Streptomyces sp. DSM 41527]
MSLRNTPPPLAAFLDAKKNGSRAKFLAAGWCFFLITSNRTVDAGRPNPAHVARAYADSKGLVTK